MKQLVATSHDAVERAFPAMRNLVSEATRQHELNWAEYYSGTQNVKRSYRQLVQKRMRNKAYGLGFDHPNAIY